MISLDQGICGDFGESGAREWLETNGQGAYAMGTVAGSNTRRYHGLLNAPLYPPLDRFQIVNRLEEAFLLDGKRHEMSCQSYPGTIYPQGFANLVNFRLDPYPVWTYAAGGARLEKSFFLRYGESTAVVLYELLDGPPVTIEARPLMTGRGHHDLTREDDRFARSVSLHDHGVAVRILPNLTAYVTARDGAFFPDGFWYRNQEYAWEQRRGFPFREDAFAPGAFKLTLRPGHAAALVISTSDHDPAGAPAWARQEQLLRRQLLEKSLVRGPVADRLVLAADQFLVTRGEGMSVMAGYPWFDDWGRDAMVSLPGLCLATGRASEAADILRVYARHVKDGLLPNRFGPGPHDVDHHTVDASLWFVWAAQKYFAATQDEPLLRELLPVMRGILNAYQHGTLHGIRMDSDGLINIDDPSQSLTWMDVRLENRPATPRFGKPVEIQALWYNALQFLAELDLKWGSPPHGYADLAAVARRSFNEKFWNESAGALYDRVNGKEKDASLRPNALLAVSLPYEILEQKYFRKLVETAARALYTEKGLRTLSPDHPAYKGRYEGPPSQRDAAYHQGTAWPWLLGPFLTAYSKAFGATSSTKNRVQEYLTAAAVPLSQGCLGTLAEIFDGNPPQTPQGCPAQAWSVAEILRVMWEENIIL